VVVAAAVLVAAGVYGTYRYVSMSGAFPEGLIQANGRIEGDTISVASKFPGRIKSVLVREGDQVEKGQVVARMDDDQVQAKVVQAHQALNAAESQLAAARSALDTSRKEVPLSIAAATAAVARANASQQKADAAEQQSARDAQRFQNLADKGSVGKQRAEQAQLALTTARSDQQSAGTALNEAQQQLSLAQLGWERIRSKEREVQALQAQVEQARAGVVDAESVLNDLTIRTPSSGIVTIKIREVGEVIAAGAPLYQVVDLDNLYLKVYVPENQIGKVRLHTPAQVFTDAYPNQPFPATTRYISSRAEFTPKEVQTADERVKLVFALKLYLDANPQHRLTPGMSADAVIRWKEGAPWATPRT
jgi:HlyD family secretion protein